MTPYGAYDASPNLQDLQEPSVANLSLTNLPYRIQDGFVGHQSQSSLAPSQMFDVSAGHTATIPPDSASESTLVSNYHDPELVQSMAVDMHFWNNQQNLQGYPFTFNSDNNFEMAGTEYCFPGDASIRTSSTGTNHTDQTFAVDYDPMEQKMVDYKPMNLDSVAQYGTFLLDDDDQSHHDASHGMN